MKHQFNGLFKIQIWAREMAQQVEVPSAQVWGPEFDPQNLPKKAGSVTPGLWGWGRGWNSQAA